jgi:hypothetical protein
VGGFRNRFHAIHAADDDQIWVVGTHSDAMGEFRILIQRYDGNSSWTTFDVPTPGLEIDALEGVLAFAPNDVWAVGDYYHAQLFRPQPLIMHYDGASWTQVQLPEYPPAELRGMTARAPDDIFAAGTYQEQGIQHPLMLHYDGATWSDVILPPTGGSAEWFLDMGAAPNGEVWAVGQYYDGSSMEPMAFRRSSATTAVEEPEADAVPRESMLSAAAPNPMRSETALRFSLDQPSAVRLRVWNAAGRFVQTLVDRPLEAGDHIVQWDGRDSRGMRVGTGVYFCDLEVGGRIERQRVTRIK